MAKKPYTDDQRKQIIDQFEKRHSDATTLRQKVIKLYDSIKKPLEELVLEKRYDEIPLERKRFVHHEKVATQAIWLECAELYRPQKAFSRDWVRYLSLMKPKKASKKIEPSFGPPDDGKAYAFNINGEGVGFPSGKYEKKE
jgi:hypothetical protein